MPRGPGRQAPSTARRHHATVPFGPLSNLASAHVHAATPDPHALEHALWENDWRADLIDPPEIVEDGHLVFPGGVGTGATINWRTLERVGGVRWKLHSYLTASIS